MWKYGWNLSPFQLIARRHPPAPLSWWVGLYVLDGTRYWVETLDDNPGVGGAWTQIQINPPSHFPFGRVVDPD